MTQEDKQLLLVDLSTRLPYGVLCVGITYDLADDGERYIPVKVKDTLTEIHNYKLETASVRLGLISSCKLQTVKPYLRPMSSMTEEEWEELNCIGHIVPLYDGCFGVDMRAYLKNNQPHYRRFSEFSTIEDWFNAHHFDYRGLIEKGLAIEAPKGMYNIKEHNKI